jgi:hypothetical protein
MPCRRQGKGISRPCLPRRTREPVSPTKRCMSACSGVPSPERPPGLRRPPAAPDPRPARLFLRRAYERKSHLKSQHAQTSGHSWPCCATI